MRTKSVKTAQNSLYLNILWHIFFIDIRELKKKEAKPFSCHHGKKKS